MKFEDDHYLNGLQYDKVEELTQNGFTRIAILKFGGLNKIKCLTGYVIVDNIVD